MTAISGKENLKEKSTEPYSVRTGSNSFSNTKIQKTATERTGGVFKIRLDHLRRCVVDPAAKLIDFLESAKNEKRYRELRERYSIDEDFSFNGHNTVFHGKGKIKAGENSKIGSNSSIQAVEDCKVEIGRNCQLSHNIKIYTCNRIADQDFSTKTQYKSGDVEIGDHCWIGHSTMIIEDVEIGENSVIGAHSFVNRDIPPHCIAVGSPAKVVKFKNYISDTKRKQIEKKYPEVCR